MSRNLSWALPPALAMLFAGCASSTGDVVAEAPVDSEESALTPHACTTPWPGAPGVFNPDCVYLAGTLHEGTAGLDAIVYPSKPNDVVGGFPLDGADRGTIRADGRLVYQDVETIRVFGDDALGSASDVPFYSSGELYPANPRANDDLVDSPACAASSSWVKTPSLMTVFPDDGKVIYACYDGTVFVEGSTAPLMPQNRIVAGGARGTTLIRSGWRKLAVRSAAGVETELAALPGYDFVLARFIDDHFIVALFDRTSNGASEENTTAERWHVALDGTATKIGDYKLDTGPMTATILFNHGKLDGRGAVYAFTHAGVPSVDQVVRYTTTRAPKVVYDETNKKVKIHISSLVTGG